MRIELKNISKKFGDHLVNDNISLVIKESTVYGILGENGAGKTTLMKILTGYLRKSSGDILVDNCSVDDLTPQYALKLGIGMLYQDPFDFPNMTVLENFMIKHKSGIFLDIKKQKSEFNKIVKELGFLISFHNKVSELNIIQRRQLELVRLISLGVKLLVLDEPATGVSALSEDKTFKKLIDKFKSEGKSIILVSHKLPDIQRICDSVIVLKQGGVSGQMDRPLDVDVLIKMMFGKPLTSTYKKPGCITSEKDILSFTNVSASLEIQTLKECNTKIYPGEIVGLSGITGSGQDVFLNVAAGIIKSEKGKVILDGEDPGYRGYHYLKKRGVFFLPGLRMEEGLISGLTIYEHFLLLNNQKKGIKHRKLRLKVKEKIEKFRIKGSIDMLVNSLSGGNQQRLLLAFLPENLKVLLLDNPTRGLDAKSMRWVWQLIYEYSRKKTAIVFSSAQIDEIMSMSQRILVFFEGKIIKDLKTGETNVTEIGKAITGKR